METNTARIPIAGVSLDRLSDAEVLAGARRLVGRSNQLLAELLAHLGEVEARGIHRTRACSSLYTYCIYELRFSEDEAFRRVAAARLSRRFPALLDALASGELHLTGLLLLGPHITEGNLSELLVRAKHRTKRELARLVRILDPLPTVPACIEPLGPAPARATLGAPTWEEFTQSMTPVRELSPGERPRDWMESANDPGVSSPDASEDPTVAAAAVPAPARVDVTEAEPLEPERYKVQFTATEEYVRLVEEAKALLSHATPRAGIEEVHLRAMRAFVAGLKKRKYGVVSKESVERVVPRRRSSESSNPRQRGRHIPAAVRRAVLERDGERCTYVDDGGRRCAETQRLEFHHLKAFAAGGEHAVSNLALRCAAHNALAAEEDFGSEAMADRREVLLGPKR